MGMSAQASVAYNIRRFRVAKGLSQEALAAEAGIDRTYVGRVERCKENPTVAVLEKVSMALGVDMQALFEPPPKGAKLPKPLSGGRKPASRS